MDATYTKNLTLFENKSYNLSYDVQILDIGASDDFIEKNGLKDYIIEYIRNYALMVGDGTYKDFVKWLDKKESALQKVSVTFVVSNTKKSSDKDLVEEENVKNDTLS